MKNGCNALLFVLLEGLKRRFSEVDTFFPSDLVSKNQENAGSQTSTYRGKLHPFELLIRLFPTQRRGVLELILKGCHGGVLRSIKCVLPSRERALTSLKTPETTLMHCNPSIPQSYYAPQSRSPYQGPPRTGPYPMYSSAPGCPYAMKEYPQKCALGQKRNIGDQEHANYTSVSADQTNIVGKVCSECLAKYSPSSNFCSLNGKCFREILYLINVTNLNTSQCRKGLNQLMLSPIQFL